MTEGRFAVFWTGPKRKNLDLGLNCQGETMNLMTHKAYTARVEYSHEDACSVGHVAGIQDVVGFHGDSVAELHEAFTEAVDDYLETCESLGRSPQKPYSGKVMLRIDPMLHAQAAAVAEAKGKSLNAWAQEVLREAVAGV